MTASQSYSDKWNEQVKFIYHDVQQIERYTKGEFIPKEIDQLWIEFILNPEWYEYYETELHLSALIHSQNNPVRK